MNRDEIEDEVKKRRLSNLRIEAADVERMIVAEDYHVFPGTTVTVCCLTLENGFNTVGQSACVHPGNFDAELGRKIAKDRALDEVWKLAGFRLREIMWECSGP